MPQKQQAKAMSLDMKRESNWAVDEAALTVSSDRRHSEAHAEAARSNSEACVSCEARDRSEAHY